jgi:enoyl-CoA hydratase
MNKEPAMTTHPDDAVLYQPATRAEPIGLLRLNRPEVRNSMSPELLEAFARRVAEAAADGHARCVVLTGAGPCFSAGADLRAPVQGEAVDASGRVQLPQERSFAMYTSFLRLLDVPVPVVGALNGHAVGGGFGLALLCDIRVGAREARYGANFARLGLHSGMGISHTLPRLVGVSRASELLFTGRLVDGEEAERIGILSRAVASEGVLAEAMGLAHEIARAAPLAVRAMKATLRASLGDVRTAAWHEAAAQAATVDTEDFAEGRRALLEKRQPDFQGR